MPDAILEEVRRFRDEFARQFNHDLHSICEELRREQQRIGVRVVSLLAKPAQGEATSQVKQSGGEERA